MSEPLVARLSRLQRVSAVAGLTGLAACLAGSVANPRQFFISHLFALTFWLGLSLGCLCVAMIHLLTGGRWGDVTRRFLEAGYMTIPLMAVLFLPLFFGLRDLYPWARPAEVAASAVLRHKAAYLNVTGFVVRAVFFFAVWIWIAFLLRRWSRGQDGTAGAALTRRARALSGPGTVIYALSVTFAWIDWVMSIDPEWSSTVFLVIICAGQVLAAFAFSILLLAWARESPPFAGLVGAGQFQQLGNLLLAFVMFWTYVSFGQLLIIWSGNLPREISWYLRRIAGGWKWIPNLLLIFGFLLPFFLLLFRSSKRRPRALALLAALVFVSRAVESYWLVEPPFFPRGFHVHWMDFAAPIGVGGLWVASMAGSLKGAALLARNDPRVSYRFAHASS